MDKEILLRLLDDPDVALKLQEVVRKKHDTIPLADEKKVKKVLSWWVKESGATITEPTIFNKKDIIKLINLHGVERVKEVIEQAFNSPLNTEENMMFHYLTDIYWILKESNFNKVKQGRYESKANTPQVYRNSENKTSDINSKLLK